MVLVRPPVRQADFGAASNAPSMAGSIGARALGEVLVTGQSEEKRTGQVDSKRRALG